MVIMSPSSRQRTHHRRLLVLMIHEIDIDETIDNSKDFTLEKRVNMNNCASGRVRLWYSQNSARLREHSDHMKISTVDS
jgi:hypothetical protein